MNMQRFPKKKNSLAKLALLVSVSWLLSTPVHAEAPMNTDDAGTLDKGGMKVEGTWSRNDKERGGEFLFGFSPVKNLELEVAASRSKDTGGDLDNKLHGVGFGAKWVPYQNETGWSLGARFDFGRTRITDRKAHNHVTEEEYAITGLASYRMKNGQALHMNLGAARTKADGESDTVGTWSIGYEIPLIDKLQLTVETFGTQHSGPDKAIGLRYKVIDGLKVSGAIGRGNDRNFGQVGFSWEF